MPQSSRDKTTVTTSMDPRANVDRIWRRLGRFGRYQVVQLLITLVTIWSAAFSLMSSVFTGHKPVVQCAPVENATYLNTSDITGNVRVEYGECVVVMYRNMTNGTTLRQEIPCPAGHQYDIPRDRSLVTEFDLVCDDGSLAEVSQMLTMAGMGLGAVLSSIISDRYGRKVVQVGAHIAIFLAGLGVAFAPNYTVLIILRFISGALQQSLAVVGAVLALEWVPEESRFICEVLGLLFWTTGVILVTPIAYLMRDNTWRELQITLTLCSSYSLIQYWIQDESVRWLLMNGKTEKAERILRKAAKWNKVNFDDVISTDVVHVDNLDKLSRELEGTEMSKENIQEVDHVENSGSVKSDRDDNGFTVERYSVITILRNKYILKNSMIMWFTWLTDSLTYFGLTLTATTLAGNRFLNYFLSGAVEYVACFLEYNMMKRIGRRSIAIIFHATSAVALLIATLVHSFGGEESSMTTISLVFTLIGKMAITGSFSTIFLFTPELYPTNLRNVGIGMSSAFARLGGMLSPFAVTLAKQASWAPAAIFTCMCFLVTMTVSNLPETRGVELPSTIGELEKWHKKQTTQKKTNA